MSCLIYSVGMKRAFLFDMDGVIVDSERVWHKESMDFAEKLFGKDILQALGDMSGVTSEQQYVLAQAKGYTVPRDVFYEKYDQEAQRIYALTTVTEGLYDFIDHLKKMKFVVGIVSSSRSKWINIVLKKLEKENLFDYILSLPTNGLASKPSPQGFIQAMHDVGTTPENTIILEDSNAGITAGKKSGAYTIAFTPLLAEGYEQIEGDAKANSFQEVEEIVRKKIGLLPIQ